MGVAPIPRQHLFLDRRTFLRGLAVGAGALAASCSVRPTRPPPPPAAKAVPQPGNGFGPTFIAGRPVERNATLRVYQWKNYLAADVIASFERRFRSDDVRVKVETFVHMDEAIDRLQRPDADYDVFSPPRRWSPSWLRSD